VMEAIKSPFNQIISNVGVEEIDLEDFDNCQNNWEHGYDARAGVFVESMIKQGIIDPVKVTRVALQNAGSISGMLLTTECVIIDPSVYSKTTSPNPMFG